MASAHISLNKRVRNGEFIRSDAGRQHMPRGRGWKEDDGHSNSWTAGGRAHGGGSRGGGRRGVYKLACVELCTRHCTRQKRKKKPHSILPPLLSIYLSLVSLPTSCSFLYKFFFRINKSARPIWLPVGKRGINGETKLEQLNLT